MANKLKTYFPLIREKEEIWHEMQKHENLMQMFHAWDSRYQEDFLDFCSGARGVKILYDGFFKEVMNPEYDAKRLEFFLSAVLEKNVRIWKVIPNDSTRIAEESSLLITDIVVELEGGALANVEIQKIGYAFPGERSACYSSDMLLRQYKRVRANKGESFSYKDIKNVYLIVIYEKSPKEFKGLPQVYRHHSRQVFTSGLQLDLLQEFIMIPLDIFRREMQNKPIETSLEAWLMFFCEDNPERVIELITKFPEFKAMYNTVYQICRNMEGVMNMFFSEELRILDRNTVRYMIDEQQKEIDEQQEKIADQKKQINNQKKEIDSQKKEIDSQKKEIDSQKKEIDSQKKQISEQKRQLNEQQEEIDSYKVQMEQLQFQMNDLQLKFEQILSNS